MMRFSEHYEGPKFRGKAFTRDEFDRYYRKKTGRDYSDDWAGHNLPPHAFNAFFGGHFNPLTTDEQWVVDAVRPAWTRWKNSGKDFYVIATNDESSPVTVRHEIAHALYYLDDRYRQAVDEIIRRAADDHLDVAIDNQSMREWMLSIGYIEDVLNDEVQATVAAGGKKFRQRWPSLFRETGHLVQEAFVDALIRNDVS